MTLANILRKEGFTKLKGETIYERDQDGILHRFIIKGEADVDQMPNKEGFILGEYQILLDNRVKESMEITSIGIFTELLHNIRNRESLYVIKKTLTIPRYLALAAERTGMNMSQVLKAALIKQLQDHSLVEC